MDIIAQYGSVFLILACLFGFFMAWGIGANDVANAMGTSVGSRALTIKQAILIAMIFEFLGAYLAGGEVTSTIRKGIIDPTVMADEPQLMVPYTLDANDMRFATPQGFNSGEQFYRYLKDTFDTLYAEGGRMMSVGLHCRLAGRPGRTAAVAEFLDYVAGYDHVWVATRGDIAKHWRKNHPPEDSF